MALQIIRNDITREKADAIVTLPHRTPEIGCGVDKAIHEKAGPELFEARKALGVIEPGDALTTPAFGLEAKICIHALGPIRGHDDANEHQLLQMSYTSILREATVHGAKSVAIPLISAGNYGYPVATAMELAVKAINKYLARNPALEVRLVVFEETAYDYAHKHWPEITRSKIDDGYVRDYMKKNPRARHGLGENEPEGYYREIEPAVNVLPFCDVFTRYSNRFMKAERDRLHAAKKTEGICRVNGEFGHCAVDERGYNTTLERIAERAGESYNYLKNLRSRTRQINPSRDRILRISKAIELTKQETHVMLAAAGHE